MAYLAIDAEDGGIEVPVVEGGGAQTGFEIFRHFGVLNADELGIDAVAKLKGEKEEGAIGWGLRDGGHGDRGH